MLKLFTTTNFIPQTETKCGEIYCYSHLDFTIYCTFCDIKLFAYDDFLLHLQNVHFDKKIFPDEAIMQYCKQTSNCEVENKELENKIEETKVFSDNEFVTNTDNANSSSEEEEESLLIIKKTKDILRNCKAILNSEYVFLKPSLSNREGSVEQIKSTELFSCPECDEKFSHKKYLDSHVYNIHNGYKCTICDRRLRLRHHLKRHILLHTAEKKYSCTNEYCNRSFSDEQSLKHHLEIHIMEKNFTCDVENCRKAFQTQRRLLIHKNIHRRPKNLVCDACGYTCRAGITLRIHQRVHTGEKPFVCEVCQKRFISKTALNQHMITHSETRPHICKICNATFANYRILQRHVFIHSDERKFKCKLCDSSFKQVHGLDGHMRRLHKQPTLLANTNDKE